MKLEQRVHKYLVVNIGIVTLLFISIIIRLMIINNCDFSGDYRDFLLPWVQVYQSNGGLLALGKEIGNYYVPYNIILALISYLPVEPGIGIAAVSCVFEYISLFYIYKIVKLLLDQEGVRDKGKSLFISLIVLFLPATILNGALWKQCDSIYACFAIISLYYILKEQYGKSIIWFAIGFCFKLQIIFLFPIYVFLYLLRKKVRIYQLFYIPLLYILMGLPAIIMGRYWKSVYGTYYFQMGKYELMTLNMPNIYSLMFTNYYVFKNIAILITFAFFVFMAVYIVRINPQMNSVNLVGIAIWCIWTCIMFLPGMHERYNYCIIILLTIYYCSIDWKKLWIAIVVNFITAFTYSKFLFSEEIFTMSSMALIHIAMYIVFTYDFVRRLHNSKCEMENETTNEH